MDAGAALVNCESWRKAISMAGPKDRGFSMLTEGKGRIEVRTRDSFESNGVVTKVVVL